MGVDWEEILGAEDADLQGAWEDNVERNDYHDENYDYAEHQKTMMSKSRK